MPWVKFSDDWYDDPKIIEAGDAGALMWNKAVSWSARNLTDGLIPAGLVRTLISSDDPPMVAARLVSLGLFVEDVTGGFRIANYHRYQPTREAVLGKREKDARRKRGDSSEVPRGIRSESTNVPNPPVPDPVPDPTLIVSPSGRDGHPQGVDDDEYGGVDLGKLWDAVTALRYEANRESVRNERSWKQRTRANLPSELGDEARALIDVFDEPVHVLAEVLEGRREKRWLNRRNGGDAA